MKIFVYEMKKILIKQYAIIILAAGNSKTAIFSAACKADIRI